MQVPRNRFFITFLLPILSLPILAGCGSNSSSKTESVCTTFSDLISAAEEIEGGQLELSRKLGGSDDQIRPTPFEIGSLGIDFALAKADIEFESGRFNEGEVKAFLDIAGSCLSGDTYQYLSNYIN